MHFPRVRASFCPFSLHSGLDSGSQRHICFGSVPLSESLINRRRPRPPRPCLGELQREWAGLVGSRSRGEVIRQLCFTARQERKERAPYPNFALQPNSAALSLHDPFS
jgi:hypothetical protein